MAIGWCLRKLLFSLRESEIKDGSNRRTYFLTMAFMRKRIIPFLQKNKHE